MSESSQNTKRGHNQRRRGNVQGGRGGDVQESRGEGGQESRDGGGQGGSGADGQGGRGEGGRGSRDGGGQGRRGRGGQEGRGRGVQGGRGRGGQEGRGRGEQGGRGRGGQGGRGRGGQGGRGRGGQGGRGGVQQEDYDYKQQPGHQESEQQKYEHEASQYQKQEQGGKGRGGQGGGVGEGQGERERGGVQQEQHHNPVQQITPIKKKMEQLSTKQMSPVQSPESSQACVISKASIPNHVTQAMLEKIPKRKSFSTAGSKGQNIQVYVNMVPIMLRTNFCRQAIHYDVSIDPDTPKCLLRNVMETVRQTYYPDRYPAFDGKKNLYSANPLPIDDEFHARISVNNENGKEKEFTVKIQKVNIIDMTCWTNQGGLQKKQENSTLATQVLDIVLRMAGSQMSIPVGQSFFAPPKGTVYKLGGGMDLWVGTFQSAVMGWKPFLNIDVAHKGFPTPQSVMSAMKEVICTNPRSNPEDVTLSQILQPTNLQIISKYLKGLKVSFCIPGQPITRRSYKIVDLGKSPRNCYFENGGQVMSVEAYFEINKRYKLKFPEWPCLWMQPKEKNIFVPCELCTIIGGQVQNKKLNEIQVSNMIRHAATSTTIRKQKIMDGFNRMRYNENETIKEFGISVGNEFERIAARVLDPPALKYNTQLPTRVKKGVWYASEFLQASTLPERKWTILSLDRYINDNEMMTLSTELQKKGVKLGMRIEKPKTPFRQMQIPRSQNITPFITYFREMKEDNIQLVIVIIPDKLPAYELVKKITELNVGILTQCLKAQTVTRKLNDATVGNILLKINTKLNGINHTFHNRPKCLERPCMIVGADVTHPAPDAMDKPSIAAVAASHDPTAFQYNIEIRLQPSRTEIITDLEQIMRSQLLFFYRRTRLKPEKILFYRDGVSEGQFPQVMYHEIEAIRRACKKLEEDYQPRITFLVVQKRHHVRFFPTDAKNSDDKNFNVRAGTIVDTMITHPEHIDFYLVSHASIQGTARPTKYRCLWDDNDMSEDDIECLTYYLCHMFSRCTRSVSYPAPTYYAHLAAFRARALTHEVNINMDRLAEEQQKLTVKTEVLHNKPMFFI